MASAWTFVTHHGMCLARLADEPRSTLRELAVHLGVTERWAAQVVTDLLEAGYLRRRREAGRYRYEVVPDMPLRHPAGRHATVGQLLVVLSGSRPDVDLAAAEGAAAQVRRLQEEARAEEERLAVLRRRAARLERALDRASRALAGALDEPSTEDRRPAP